MGFAPAARDISDIKVTHSDQLSSVLLEWTDGAMVRQEHLVCGYSATRVTADLRACDVVGEDARRSYLLGVIRGITIERRSG